LPGNCERNETVDDDILNLANDAPGDDRTDLALRARADAYGQADALNWLMESTPSAASPAAAATPEPAVESRPSGAGGALSAIESLNRALLQRGGLVEGGRKLGTGVDPVAVGGEVAGLQVPSLGRTMAARNAGDAWEKPSLNLLVRGFGEMPRQAVGGIRDAVASFVDFDDWR
jgi:hypothetical protein